MSAANDPPVLGTQSISDSQSSTGTLVSARQGAVARLTGAQAVLILIMIVISDLCLYQGGGGYSGWAAWIVVVAACTIAAISAKCSFKLNRWCFLASGMLTLTALRAVWQGNWCLTLFGWLWLLTIVLLVHGVAWAPSAMVGIAWRFFPQGLLSLTGSTQAVEPPEGRSRKWLEFGIPALLTCGFGGVLLMANPDAVHAVTDQLRQTLLAISRWVGRFSPLQPVIWITMGIGGVGLIVPCWHNLIKPPRPDSSITYGDERDSKFFSVSRNSLLALIVLFTIYIVTEFSTMWFREFPAGFYYSGYAHAGAAWLTLALGLSTLVISTIFHPRIVAASTYSPLLRLTRIWFLLNLLLAICVYHRLAIYVDYNGMTRMRVVAMLGVACVVTGLCLVMIKASQRRTIGWLLERQVLAFFAFVFLLAVLPVDWLVYSYNRRQIERGREAPAVQIAEHELSASALLAVLPLIHSQDAVISQGVSALVSKYLSSRTSDSTWQRFQLSDWELRRQVQQDYASTVGSWQSSQLREQAIEDFRDRVWMWY